jgi:hypothetical protein
VFHEGLKSWSCCSDVNKPVMEFEAFMKIAGCTSGEHTDIAPSSDTPKAPTSVNLKMTEAAGSETYSVGSTGIRHVPRTTPVAPALEEEEDDPTIPVAPGTTCQRKGCGVGFVSDDISRHESGEGAVCMYHPRPPIFHEGSKGYLCCKRRVLEFDEFLKIEGCKQGRHVFVPKREAKSEEMTDCRIDHYQTLTDVHVSVFAKKVDKERSSVRFDENSVGYAFLKVKQHQSIFLLRCWLTFTFLISSDSVVHWISLDLSTQLLRLFRFLGPRLNYI